MKIPIKINLRQQEFTMTRTALGVNKATKVWVYHSFKRRFSGTVIARSRAAAKNAILDICPDAEFYR